MTATSAKRTNRALLVVAVSIMAVAGVTAALTGTQDSTTVATTTAPVVSAPTNQIGRRPAETGYSWFNHGFAAEQFDAQMPSLSCMSMAEWITADLCGVARGGAGAFMVLGTEGFWDPNEVDADGLAWIPFDLTVFVMRDDPEGPLAVSVMDGFTNKAYTNVGVTIDLYSATIDSEQVLVLHQRLSDEEADAFDYRESIQVMVMSPTGAPTIVATYEGYQLRVAATGSSIELSSLRYRTTSTSPTERFFTRVSLLPATSNSINTEWDEIATTSTVEVPHTQAMTPLDTYSFPIFQPGNSF